MAPSETGEARTDPYERSVARLVTVCYLDGVFQDVLDLYSSRPYHRKTDLGGWIPTRE